MKLRIYVKPELVNDRVMFAAVCIDHPTVGQGKTRKEAIDNCVGAILSSIEHMIHTKFAPLVPKDFIEEHSNIDNKKSFKAYELKFQESGAR